MTAAKEFYYFIFYVLYRAELFKHGRSYNEWKAFAGITFLELCLILIADWWASMLGGSSYFLGLPRGVIVLVCVVLALANYRALLYGGRWEGYAHRFSKYSRTRRRIRTVLAVIFILLVMSLFGYTLLELAERRLDG